jgi:hypothetical protein
MKIDGGKNGKDIGNAVDINPLVTSVLRLLVPNGPPPG